MTDKSEKKAKLVQGDVSKTLINLTVPMIIGIFAIVGFGLVDSYFISLLGTKELAAVSFTFPVGMVLSNIAIGLGVGVSSVLSRIIGQGDSGRAQRIATDSIFLAVVLVVIICVAGLLTINPLFTALGAEADVLPIIHKYMYIYYFAIPFLVIPIVGNSAIRATGDTKTPSIIMVVAAVGNAILDPLLIFGLWGFPELGIEGAAYATLFGWMFSTIAALWVLGKREHLLSFVKPKLSEVLHSWRDVLYIGVPAAATYSLAPIASGVLLAIVATYGTEAVAAYGVGVRVEPIAIIIALGLSAALPVFVGQNWGAKKFSRVKDSISKSKNFILVSHLFIAALLFVSGKYIAKAFSDEAEVIDLIVVYLCIVPWGFAGLGVSIIGSSVFNAVNKPFKAMSLNVLRLFVCFVPFAWLGSHFYGLKGLFYGMMLGNVFAGIIAWYWLRKDFLQLEPQADSIDTA